MSKSPYKGAFLYILTRIPPISLSLELEKVDEASRLVGHAGIGIE
jgi:hypothetical protein